MKQGCIPQACSCGGVSTISVVFLKYFRAVILVEKNEKYNTILIYALELNLPQHRSMYFIGVTVYKVEFNKLRSLSCVFCVPVNAFM